MRSTFFFTILAFFTWVFWSFSEEKNGLKNEVKTLLGKVHTEALKKEIKWRAEVLHNKNLQKTAILFFYDIKAKGVLCAVLRSQDWTAKKLILDNCLDLFGPEDIPLLFEAAFAHADPPLLRVDTGSLRPAEQGIIRELAKRTGIVLGLGPNYPTLIREHSAENIRAWWLKALHTAKDKGTWTSPLDKAIKYLETPKEKNKEP